MRRAFVILLLLVVACDERDQTGLETDNWALPCALDEPCPGRLECLCGLCTTTCAADANTATCEFGICLNADLVTRCGAESAESRLCGIRCVEDAECRNLGLSYVCSGGLCARSDNTGPDLDAGTDLDVAPDPDLADAADVSDDGGGGPVICRSGEPCACETGEECELACPGGGCDAVCESGSACNLDCGGGACIATCEAMAECTLGCSGGLCEVTCGSEANCSLDCSGGDCQTRCAAGATCVESCPAGCATTCATTATCTSDCADACTCEGGGC